MATTIRKEDLASQNAAAQSAASAFHQENDTTMYSLVSFKFVSFGGMYGRKSSFSSGACDWLDVNYQPSRHEQRGFEKAVLS